MPNPTNKIPKDRPRNSGLPENPEIKGRRDRINNICHVAGAPSQELRISSSVCLIRKLCGAGSNFFFRSISPKNQSPYCILYYFHKVNAYFPLVRAAFCREEGLAHYGISSWDWYYTFLKASTGNLQDCESRLPALGGQAPSRILLLQLI